MFYMKAQRGKLVSGGRLQVPVDIRRALGLADGDPVLLRVVDGELHVRPVHNALSRVQAREAHFSDACISTVNLSEVVAKLVERGVPAESIQESLSDLDLDVRDFDTAQALRAGALRNATRVRGLSLGDRACLALAGELKAIALTTDAAWTEIDLGIAVELAR